MTEEDSLCPCGSKQTYDNCCKPYHLGEKVPLTAELLMRSRYSAFAKNEFDYLNKTNHPDVAENHDSEQNRELYRQFTWLGLRILDTQDGLENDTEGYVDFSARYLVGGGEHAIREKSFFKKDNGKWFYVQGKSLQVPQDKTNKTGRNDPCPCGSGKKFKKCCMNK